MNISKDTSKPGLERSIAALRENQYRGGAKKKDPRLVRKNRTATLNQIELDTILELSGCSSLTAFTQAVARGEIKIKRQTRAADLIVGGGGLVGYTGT